MRLLYKCVCSLFLFLLFAFSVLLMVGDSANPLPFHAASMTLDRIFLIKVGFLIWLIFPPTAMFFDLTVLARNFDLVDIELVKYTHESLKNTWLAFVVAYIAVFGYATLFAGG